MTPIVQPTVAADQAQQNAVTLKLPDFWTSQPQAWFQQAEAQFHFRRITADDTRYFYVVAALHLETAGHLVPYLREPLAANKYEGLKVLLLRTFGLSRLD